MCGWILRTPCLTCTTFGFKALGERHVIANLQSCTPWDLNHFAQGHSASQWRQQGLGPGLLDSGVCPPWCLISCAEVSVLTGSSWMKVWRVGVSQCGSRLCVSPSSILLLGPFFFLLAISLVTQLFPLAPILGQVGVQWFGTGWAVLAEGKLQSTKGLVLSWLYLTPGASHLKAPLHPCLVSRGLGSLLPVLCPKLSWVPPVKILSWVANLESVCQSLQAVSFPPFSLGAHFFSTFSC